MLRTDTFAVGALAALAVTTLITLLLEPPRARATAHRVLVLLVLAGTSVAYLAVSPWLFLAGWALTLVPFWFPADGDRGPGVVLLMSTLALTVAFLLAARHGGSELPLAASALITTAALLRQGIFPFHSWVPQAFDRGELPVLNLFLNGHLGLYALIRFGLPASQAFTPDRLRWLGGLAIVTAVYAGLLAIVARRPRRTLAWLWVSEAAFILSGIVNGAVEGVTGALVHWWVVSLASSVLIGVYGALEARTTEVETPRTYLGLGFHAPRFAVAFVVGVLALVGLPGTLGFFAEDLLFHDALVAHPLLGAGLPAAAALTAIAGFRLFATLFLGRRGIHVPQIPDVRLGERWGVTLPIVILMVGGLLPSLVVALRVDAAMWIVGLLTRQ